VLSLPSKILLRSEHLLQQGSWLLVNPCDAQIFSELDNPEIYGFHQYFDIYQQSVDQTHADKHTFAASYPCEPIFDGVVVYMPKSKTQAQMLLANVASCLKPNATVLLVGENKGGIKSAPKLLEPFTSQVNKIDSARHCALFAGLLDKPVTQFELTQWQSISTLNVADLSFEVCSLPGVFSHGELDTGTRVLLENLAPIPKGRLLDFACGAGIIGCFIGLKAQDSQVVMSDVSALALHCAALSAQLNGLKVHVIPSNGLTEIKGRFDSIYTNPPFHTGTQTDYSVTEFFLGQIKQHLNAGATLTLVANKFLRYSDALEGRFASVTPLAQTTKFSLYHCRRCK
jgi:16S rRNA (guanine1207-N2)-methyltransferase